MRRGVDASRETIVNECEPDVAACRAYADDAMRLEQRAVAALEWIKKKYLLKANAWKKDLETRKAIREALAEELGSCARRRRRGRATARARGVRGVHGGPEGKRRLRQGAPRSRDAFGRRRGRT